MGLGLGLGLMGFRLGLFGFRLGLRGLGLGLGLMGFRLGLIGFRLGLMGKGLGLGLGLMSFRLGLIGFRVGLMDFGRLMKIVASPRRLQFFDVLLAECCSHCVNGHHASTTCTTTGTGTTGRDITAGRPGRRTR